MIILKIITCTCTKCTGTCISFNVFGFDVNYFSNNVLSVPDTVKIQKVHLKFSKIPEKTFN